MDVAELAGVNGLLEAGDGGVEEQEVADHEGEAAALGLGDKLACLPCGEGEGLLDVAVLACGHGLHAERVMGHGGGGNAYGIDLGVGEHRLEVARELRVGVQGRECGEAVLVLIDAVLQAGGRELGEVADEVFPPVAGADHGDGGHVSGSPISRRFR